MSRRSRDPAGAALSQIVVSNDAASLAANIRAAREAGHPDAVIRARVQSTLRLAEEQRGTSALIAFAPAKTSKVADVETLRSLYPDLQYVGRQQRDTSDERMAAIAAVFADVVVRNMPVHKFTNREGLSKVGKAYVDGSMELSAPPPPPTTMTAVAVGKAAPAATASAPRPGRSASVSPPPRAAPAASADLGNWSKASSIVAGAASAAAIAAETMKPLVTGAASAFKGVTPSMADVKTAARGAYQQTAALLSDLSAPAAAAAESVVGERQQQLPLLPVQSSSTRISNSKAMTVDQIVDAMESFRLDDAENAQEMAKLTRAIRALQTRLASDRDRRVLGVEIKAGRDAMVLPLAALVLYE